MLKPIHITKERTEAMKSAFIRDAMKEFPQMSYSDAAGAFDYLHKRRAVFPEGREPVTKTSMADLLTKASAQVAEMKKVLNR